jgi:type IV secretion system protein VirB9
LFALGCLVVALLLSIGLIWLGRSGTAVPFVVEVDRNGAVRAIAAATENYRPSDAQIAFHLARFIENVRSLSIDPVVVRQNWLRAYDYATDRAALTLNEYAREHDPFAGIGRITVAVEVASVVRAPIHVSMVANAADNGAAKEAKRHRNPVDRHHAAADGRGRAQEPTRHLRARPQLVARPQPRREQMNVARWLAAAAITILGACAQRVLVPEVMLDNLDQRRAEAPKGPKRQVEFVEVPTPLPLPGQLKPLPNKRVVDKDKVAPDTPGKKVEAANTAAKVEPSSDGFINAIQVYPYTRARFTSSTAPSTRSPTSRSRSARNGLGLGRARSLDRRRHQQREGKTAQVHILVKPIAADLTTNLVITTDRRTYHLELNATEKTYMASVSWTYPPADLIALKREIDPAWTTSVDAGPDLAALKFRYRIEGDAPWKPQRVFDDGIKVYIQFPSGLKQG